MSTSSRFAPSPLAIAARGGNRTLLKQHLGGDPRIDIRSPCGWTPLADAAFRGHVDIVGILLSHGAEPNFVARDGTSPLMLAAEQGHTIIVEGLIDHGADIELESNSGARAFEYAVQNTHPEIARLLHARGAPVEPHEAVLYLRAVLRKKGILCTRMASRDHRALRWTVDQPLRFEPGELAPIRSRLGPRSSQDCRVTRIEFDTGESFRHTASSNIPVGEGTDLPDLHWRYRRGWCIPAQAVWHGEHPPDRPDENGHLPILEAIRRGHGTIVRALLETGVDPNLRPNYGLMRGATLMMNAAEVGSVSVIDALLESGADPDAQSPTEWTALMTATSRGHIHAVNRLLEVTKRLDSRNAQGKTALDLAVDRRYPHIARVLIAAINRSGQAPN